MTRRATTVRIAALAGALAAALAVATPANADTTINVTTTADETATESPVLCSLREAIDFANGSPDNTDCAPGMPSGTTTIDLPAGQYAVSSSELMITGAAGATTIVIQGAGANSADTALNGRFGHRDLEIAAGANVSISDVSVGGGEPIGQAGGGILNAGTLALHDVAVVHNLSGFTPVSSGAGSPGGGIANSGTLAIDASAIAGNGTAAGYPAFSAGAGGAGGMGGAIVNSGTLTITNTTIENNTSGGGGPGASGGAGGAGGPGGAIANSGTLAIGNSTIDGNRAGSGGSGPPTGAGGAGGAIYNTGTETITNSTLTGNLTGAGAPGGAGPAIEEAGSGTLRNDTIAANGDSNATAGGIDVTGTLSETATIAAANLPANCAGSPADGGNNLSFGDASCPGIGGDPMLGPLQGNGGLTLTMALKPGSAAIDRIPPAACGVATDQRGAARPGGGACDIGAYEVASPLIGGYGIVAAGPGSATVTAPVNPNATDTTVYVQYGYAWTNGTPVQDIGDGTAGVPVSVPLTGLAPGSTTHYRFVATNRDGTTIGPDQTVTTPLPATGPSIPQPLAGALNPANPLVDLVVPNGVLMLPRHSRTIAATIRNRNPFFVTGNAHLQVSGVRGVSSGPIAANGISLPASSSRTLYLTLGEHVLAGLRHKRRMPVTIVLRLYDEAGHKTTVTARYVLAAPPRPGH